MDRINVHHTSLPARDRSSPQPKLILPSSQWNSHSIRPLPLHYFMGIKRRDQELGETAGKSARNVPGCVAAGMVQELGSSSEVALADLSGSGAFIEEPCQPQRCKSVTLSPPPVNHARSAMKRCSSTLVISPDADKEKILGEAAFQARKADRVNPEDFVGWKQDRKWGNVGFIASLRDILGQKEAKNMDGEGIEWEGAEIW
ncbi:MAG: hypothetical protein M1389_00455 [Chloroflexi bacterium]|nr:hypothetical protein [Chloroflexota bacterium]